MWRGKLVWLQLVVIIVTSFFGWFGGVSVSRVAAQNTDEATIRKAFKSTRFSTTNPNAPPPGYPMFIKNSVGAGNRPYILPNVRLPDGKTSEGTPIVFKLDGFAGGGAATVGNRDWLIFGGYLQQGGQFTSIPNLYLMLDDQTDSAYDNQSGDYIIYDTDKESVLMGKFDDTLTVGPVLARIDIDLGDIHKVFSYIFNAPKSYVNGKDNNQSCAILADTDLVKTGPNENPQYLPFLDSDKAELLNGDCVNTSTDGWLKSWGITSIWSAPKEDTNCGLSAIFQTNGGIGGIVTNVIACVVGGIIDGVLGPLSKSAQDFGSNNDSLETKLSNPNDGLVKGWLFVRSLINILVVIALIAIAFANILHLNINTYAAKKALPGLVLGVIGANASLLIIRFILDVVQSLMQLSYELAGVTTGLSGMMEKLIHTLGGGIQQVPLSNLLIGPFVLFIIIFAVVYFVILIVGFAFVLLKRLVFLYALIIVAPLAFVCNGVPNLQQWFGKWWDMFLRQAFVLPIIFLAVGIFIQFGEKIGLTVDLKTVATNAGNPKNADLLLLALTFGIATMILKLPGLITKGALDVANISKKAFNTARNAPATAWAGAGIATKPLANWSKGKAKDLDARILAAAGNQSLQRRLKMQKWLAQRPGKLNDATLAARGRAYITANPEKTILPWWASRLEAGEKASSLEASKANLGVPGVSRLRGNVSDIVAGRAGGYISKLKLARELVKENVSSIDEAMSGATSESLMKAVLEEAEKLGGKKVNANGNVTWDDPRAAVTYLQKVAGAKKPDDMAKIVNDLSSKGYAGVKNQGLFAEGDTVARIEYINAQSRRNDKDPAGQWDKITDAKSRAVPYGAGGIATTSGTVNAAQLTDELLKQRIEQAFSHGSLLKSDLGGDLQRQLIDNMEQMAEMAKMRPDDPGFGQAIANIKSALTESVDDSLGEQATKLKEEIGSINDPGTLHDLAQNFSIADQVRRQGGDFKSNLSGAFGQLNQQAGEFHQVSAAAVNQIDYGHLEQTISQAMKSGQADLAPIFAQSLAKPIQDIGASLGKDSLSTAQLDAITRKFSDRVSQAINAPGSKSVRGVIQNAMSSLGSDVAKHLDTPVLSNQAMINQTINQIEPTSPSTQPTQQQPSAPAPQPQVPQPNTTPEQTPPPENPPAAP